MELNRKALEDVKFRSRGRWYDAQQVDAFLEELTVAVDEEERKLEGSRQEVQTLSRKLDVLRRENQRLWQELNALREAPLPAPEPEAVEAARRKCRELEQERDGLIEDVKALRRFRETFRKAVEKDAGDLLEQAGSLGSEKLL